MLRADTTKTREMAVASGGTLIRPANVDVEASRVKEVLPVLREDARHLEPFLSVLRSVESRWFTAPFWEEPIVFGSGFIGLNRVEFSYRAGTLHAYMFSLTSDHLNYPHVGCCGSRYVHIKGFPRLVATLLRAMYKSWREDCSPAGRERSDPLRMVEAGVCFSEVERLLAGKGVRDLVADALLSDSEPHAIRRMLKRRGWSLTASVVPYDRLVLNPSLSTLFAYYSTLHHAFKVRSTIRSGVLKVGVNSFFFAVKLHDTRSGAKYMIQLLPIPRRVWIVYSTGFTNSKLGVPVEVQRVEDAVEVVKRYRFVYSAFSEDLQKQKHHALRLYQPAGYTTIYKPSYPPRPLTVLEAARLLGMNI